MDFLILWFRTPSVPLKAGSSVVFARVDKMFKHLKLSSVDGSRDRAIGAYIRADLLIIDDFAIKDMKR